MRRRALIVEVGSPGAAPTDRAARDPGLRADAQRAAVGVRLGAAARTRPAGRPRVLPAPARPRRDRQVPVPRPPALVAVGRRGGRRDRRRLGDRPDGRSLLGDAARRARVSGLLRAAPLARHRAHRRDVLGAADRAPARGDGARHRDRDRYRVRGAPGPAVDRAAVRAVRRLRAAALHPRLEAPLDEPLRAAELRRTGAARRRLTAARRDHRVGRMADLHRDLDRRRDPGDRRPGRAAARSANPSRLIPLGGVRCRHARNAGGAHEHRGDRDDRTGRVGRAGGRPHARLRRAQGRPAEAAAPGRGPGARDPAHGRGGLLLHRRDHAGERGDEGARTRRARAARRPPKPLRLARGRRGRRDRRGEAQGGFGRDRAPRPLISGSGENDAHPRRIRDPIHLGETEEQHGQSGHERAEESQVDEDLHEQEDEHDRAGRGQRELVHVRPRHPARADAAHDGRREVQEEAEHGEREADAERTRTPPGRLGRGRGAGQGRDAAPGGLLGGGRLSRREAGRITAAVGQIDRVEHERDRVDDHRRVEGESGVQFQRIEHSSAFYPLSLSARTGSAVEHEPERSVAAPQHLRVGQIELDPRSSAAFRILREQVRERLGDTGDAEERSRCAPGLVRDDDPTRVAHDPDRPGHRAQHRH
ncbi:hypothetical protein CRE_20659, partial [Caenorhabditis remanei]